MTLEIHQRQYRRRQSCVCFHLAFVVERSCLALSTAVVLAALLVDGT